MTKEEFLSLAKSRGATFWPGDATSRDTQLTNSALQTRRCAMLPPVMIDLYKSVGTINLGAGYIFGPKTVERPGGPTIPSIAQLNQELSQIPTAQNKTIFGRNDLFWFAFDAFGTFFLADNITLKILRKYDDPYRAMIDCLIAGKL